MSVGKLCGMAIIVVAIAPLLLGMIWPTDTETVDTWDVEPAMDLTGDLNNRVIPVFDRYAGPLNNLTVISAADELVYPDPVATTDVQNSWPVPVPTSGTASGAVIGDLANLGYTRWTAYGTMVYSGDGGSYGVADYFPATNALTLWAEGEPHRFTPAIDDRLTASGADLQTVSYGAAAEYIDPAQGLSFQGGIPFYWTNNMLNRDVTLWIRFEQAPIPALVHVGGIKLEHAIDNTVTVTFGNGDPQQIGSVYDMFEIYMDVNGNCRVSGLIGAENFSDVTYTEGNSVTYQAAASSDPMPTMGPMRGSYASWWVKSAEAGIGSTKGMRDVSVVPDSYYPSHAWQLQLLNPSTFGSQISVGSIDLPVVSGSVTVTDWDNSETTEVQVRSMKILSLVLDGKQQIYVNGIKIIEQIPAAVSVDLDGDWYVSVVMSKVTQSTQERYVWHVGSFGFDQTEFCLVGLLSCVGVAIGGTIWGRRNGERMLALHLTMILAGVAYLVMM